MSLVRDTSDFGPAVRVPSPKSAADRGAALVIALFIMFILLAIALTFYSVSRIQFQTATNVGNTVRAELLSEAATALAINELKKDSIDHPDVTSTDHAWTTRFNGLWAAEKSWTRPPWEPSIGEGGIPIVFYDDYQYVNPLTGATFNAPGVRRGNQLMPHLFVPRVEHPRAGFPNGYLANYGGYDDVENRFVFEPLLDPKITYAERVDPYCDVDNDGDGFRDSIWIPLAQDYLIQRTEPEDAYDPIVDVDFNLEMPNQDLPDPLRPQRDARSSVLFYPGTLEPRNGRNGWFLTAPLLNPDGSFIVLRNLYAAGLPFDSASTGPAGGLLDAVDNDYDGIINYHVEYYARRDGRDPTEAELELPLGKHILSKAKFEQLLGLGFTEIHEHYLPNPNYRVCTTGEPFCELAGRAAILIRDETSKVNMNAAGAHYLDAPSLILAQLDDTTLSPAALAASDLEDPFLNFWLPSFASGASTGEYLTQILPRVGPSRGLKFWNLLTGAPNGSMHTGEDMSGDVPAEYLYDVTLPGYGFVDDNANAFMLAFNGIDDNGNGLIDEGTNTGDNLTPEQVELACAYALRCGILDTNLSAAQNAALAYRRFIAMGILEGVDEPGEFQQSRPNRNRLAEADGIDSDRNGVIDEIGELGDRPLPTRDYLKRAMLNEEVIGGAPAKFASNFVGRLRPFVTIESGLKNNRTEKDENGNVETLGPKLNYNIASAAQLAKAFIEDWKLDEQNLYDPEKPLTERLSSRYQPEDVEALTGRYITGSMTPAEADEFLTTAFLQGMRSEGAYKKNVTINIDGSPVQFDIPNDPQLRAMQLAANIVDSADTDYARTELSTDQLQQFEFDPWWYALQIAGGTLPEMAKKPISYTVAGIEAIRINEIMVRPVRRIEAELDWDNGGPDDLFYDPAIAIGSAYRVDRYSIGTEVRSIPGYANLKYAAASNMWDLGWNPQVAFPDGVIGGSAVMGTTAGVANVTVSDTDTPANSRTFPLANVIEYRFGPSKHLPPGRYYLTFNTNNSVGEPILDSAANLKFAVKYVCDDAAGVNPFTINTSIDPAAPALSNISVDTSGRLILDDLVLSEYEFTTAYAPDFSTPVLGREDQRNDSSAPSGWFFCSGKEPPNVTGIEDGYVRDFQAHTVTIPPYAPTSGEQIYLHVAVYYDSVDYSSLPDGLFTLNFFDFSQEPDHEWVELENVSGQPVDIAGWELVVGGPNGEGDIVTQDKAVMRVPAENGPVVLEPSPPYNRVLLAVSAISPPLPNFVEFPALSDIYRDSPFMWNGIGQVGTPSFPIQPDLAAYPSLTLDAFTTTVPLIPLRVAGVFDPALPYPTGWVDDGKGNPNSTEWPVFQAPDAPRRIIQVQVPGLNAELQPMSLEGAENFIANWVLRGGVFPNYPEHDAIDNDYDAHILAVDGVDYTFEGAVAHPYGLGVDEGRWDLGAGRGVPGSFSWLPVPLFLMTPDGGILSRFYPPGNFPSLDYPYLWALDSQPEWKEFTERRLYPGDNVVVSLFQGDPHDPGEARLRKLLVDRITYTERDIVNRSISDFVPVTDPDNPNILIRPPLHYNTMLDVANQPYLYMWPDNTMGIDFYRSLERKHHPLYNGDRFGTQNRWQATDGNYDDWSHYTVGDIADGFLPKAFSGTPLGRNDAAWNPDNYGGAADALLYQLDVADIRNRPFDSVGDTLSLAYFGLNKVFGGYGSPLSSETVAGFQPNGDLGSLVEAGVTDSFYLSPGSAETFYRDDALADAEDLEFDPLPEAWRPFFLYEISSAMDAEPPPPGLPSDDKYWLFNPPTRPIGLEDPQELRARWPVQKRAVLFASENLDNTSQGAKLFIEWDDSSGLEDGTYDLYIDTGLKLVQSPTSLTPTGELLRSWMVPNVAERPGINVTVYTDRNGDNKIEREKPGYPGPDTYGQKVNLRPDSQGHIWCGTVTVNNKRFALDIQNVAESLLNTATTHTLNTFAGVILTPRDRTEGRININTAETRLYDDWDANGWFKRRLNVLAGLPGIYRPMADSVDWSDYTFKTVAQASPGYNFGVLFRYSGRGGYLLRFLDSPVNGGAITLHEITDGTMGPALDAIQVDDSTSDFNITIYVHDNQPSATEIIYTVNGVTRSVDTPIRHPYGTVALMSANPAAGFLPTPSVRIIYDLGGTSRTLPMPFDRGWSGEDWVFDGSLYLPGGETRISAYNGYLDWADPAYYDAYDAPPRQDDPWSSSDQDYDSKSPYMRAEWLAKMRDLVGRHWDGRYFQSEMDLLGAERNPLNDDMLVRPLSLDPDNYGDESYPNFMDPAALAESTWRLARMANQITTRSDIFEIIVTVQAGTGDDVDGDGIINYRSPEEFTVTSQRQTRTIYERP